MTHISPLTLHLVLSTSHCAPRSWIHAPRHLSPCGHAPLGGKNAMRADLWYWWWPPPFVQKKQKMMTVNIRLQDSLHNLNLQLLCSAVHQVLVLYCGILICSSTTSITVFVIIIIRVFYAMASTQWKDNVTKGVNIDEVREKKASNTSSCFDSEGPDNTGFEGCLSFHQAHATQ